MKKEFSIFDFRFSIARALVLCLVVLLVLAASMWMGVMVAHAQGLALAPGAQTEPPAPAPVVDIGLLVAELAGMAGVSGAIALLINIGKTLGWVKDGQSQTISAVINFIVLGALLAARIFTPNLNIGQIDQGIQNFVAVGATVFAYIVQLFASQKTHEVVTGVPVIGKSFTLERTKQLEADRAAALAGMKGA
jgi:hypothetical protein